ncbi:Crp/Fnr family transcriptional regulator [Pseudanabaenaceae cyanobacterium LEGE 13415]|nr:Crp/Fnr family transcriptional regulator [Pseudanabaenaceae cyanobacterium LEGE 13415]
MSSLRGFLQAMFPPKNQLLTALPSDGRDHLTPFLEAVNLSFGQILYEPNQAIEYAYFPITAVIAHLNLLEGGREVESAVIGNEGMIGIPLILGTESIPMRSIVQIAGTALRIPATTLQAELNMNRSLHTLLLRYVQTLMNQIAQNLTCTHLHATQERCCYLLLLLQDRVGNPELSLTLDLLSRMVGVRRDRIGEIVTTLERAGLIHHQRGRITILDRAGLESAACDCYQILRSQFDRTFEE